MRSGSTPLRANLYINEGKGNMPAKRDNPKYQRAASLEIVVTKLVVIGLVNEAEGSDIEMSPVEAAMAMIGRDIDRTYAASDVNNRITNNVDSYGFNVAGDRFVIEVRSTTMDGEAS